MSQVTDRSGPGFTDLLLLGVALLMLTAAGLGVALYAWPGERLQLPELEPSLRVARVADLPVGGSRVVNWGARIILVVRSGDSTYFALGAVSPVDGCILRWDAEALRVVSPCGYVVYDQTGNVVVGLTREPLERYAVAVREGVVYVTELPR
jgi:nitrite reductase/ring-hydroxylating ferredoxin subunit